MSMTFYRYPNLLLDAEELIYACVNARPAESITKDAPYCIPLGQVEQMLSDVRKMLPETPELLRFFRAYPLPRWSSGAHTCVARLLVYTFFDCAAPDADTALQDLSRAWDLETVTRQRQVFTDAQPFGLTMSPQDIGELPPAMGLNRLPLPEGLRQELTAVFSDYAGSIRELGALMRPVMVYLTGVLGPSLKRAEPFIESWEKKMEGMTPGVFALEYLHYQAPRPIEDLSLSVMFFNPEWAVCRLVDGKELRLALGVGEPWNAGPNDFAPWEYRALRLLGSPARMQMLRALEQKPMSSREMAKELGLHLGAVTRDVSSMYEELLLNMELQGSRRRYSVNHKALETIIRHLQGLLTAGQTEE